MRFVKRLFMGIGAVVLAGFLLTLVVPKAIHAAVATLVQVANTATSPVPITDVSKGNPVMLSCLASGTTCSSFRQVNASGVQSPSDYSIPPGDTLIVTDVEWEAVGGLAGRFAFLNFACTSGCGFVYSSRVVADSAGIASTADHLTSGVALVYLPTVTVGDAVGLSYLALRGYLVPTP
jgi:hypothetical protein